MGPIRLRSKISLLIYHEINYNEKLKTHLETVFGIRQNVQWNYIFKTEHRLDKQTNVLVFLECQEAPDVYSNKLAFSWENKLIQPHVYCLAERSLLLRLILTFHGDIENGTGDKTNIVTNMDLDVLQDNMTFLEPTIVLEAQKQKRNRKPFTQKQRDLFNKHAALFDETLKSEITSKSLLFLDKKIRAMRNYPNTHSVPIDILNKLDVYNRKYKNIKGKIDETEKQNKS